jgi:hypothetical protein
MNILIAIGLLTATTIVGELRHRYLVSLRKDEEGVAKGNKQADTLIS